MPGDITFETARDALLPLIDKVWRHCESAGTRGRTVTLKIKYADFQQITRSQSPRGGIAARAALERIALELLAAQFPVVKGIRLLGSREPGPAAPDAPNPEGKTFESVA
jgi:DNA polymerase-4